MVAHTYTIEIVSKVSAHRMFKAKIVHRHVIIQTIKPDVFRFDELVQGDGGAGTIRKIHLVEGHPFKSLVVRVDEWNVEKLRCKYTIIEGDVLQDNLEKIEYVADYEDLGNQCKAKVAVHYHPKPGCSGTLTVIWPSFVN